MKAPQPESQEEQKMEMMDQKLEMVEQKEEASADTPFAGKLTENVSG